MKKTIFLCLLLSLVMILSLNTVAAETRRTPRINFKGITSDDFIGQVGVLYPFKNTEKSVQYTDFRYRISENDVKEWNIGLGHRQKINNPGKYIAGIYIFRDRREELNHYWNMWTIGGEILTDEWDFRVNAYLSDNEIFEVPEHDTITEKNNQLIYEKAVYSSMDGLDIELGKRFTNTNSIFKNVGIYGKLFRFFEVDTSTMKGKQIRIDKQFGDKDKTTWKLGVQWRDDNIRGSETEATFVIAIPFGETNTKNSKKDTEKEDILESKMTEQPERDLDVVIVKNESNGKTGENIAYDPFTGEKMDHIEYISADIDNLAEKINNSKAKVIILNGNNSDAILNKTIVLDIGQKLLSPTGSLLLSADPSGLRTTFFRPKGEQIRIKLNDDNFIGNNAIELNEDNTISGLEIVNNSGKNKGIYKATLDVDNAPDIRDNNIKAFDFGIYFENISGSNPQNKLDNLKRFNIVYEEINEISGVQVVDVHDHVIKDWYDLNSVRYNLDGTYLMKNDLDNKSFGYSKLASSSSDNGKGWQPIGDYQGDFSKTFTGYFDGQSYKISDLYINRGSTNYIGLFGFTYYSTINNLGLENVNITGNSNLGGLVGFNYYGDIEDSYVVGEIIGKKLAGGLAGFNINGTINNSYTEVIVGVDYSEAGGLVGKNEDGNIANSYASGDVTGSDYIGGLVGDNEGDIEKSFSTAKVTGVVFVGGLVGGNGVTGDGNIANSYAIGDVRGESHFGGFVGYQNGNIKNSYAIGNVVGEDDSIGGLIGYNSFGNPENSYWNTETSGQESSSGGEGKTTEQMKAGSANSTIDGEDIYITWDEEIWNFGTDFEYPYLEWQGNE